MEIIFYFILTFLFLVHISLFWRQIHFIKKQPDHKTTRHAQGRAYLVLSSHLFNVLWCALLWLNFSAPSIFQITALILGYLFIKKVTLCIIQQVIETHIHHKNGQFIQQLKQALRPFLLQCICVLILTTLALTFKPLDMQLSFIWFWAVWFIFDTALISLGPGIASKFTYRVSSLKDDGLKTSIQKLFQKMDLRSIPLVIADGSARPDHANARLEGIGPLQRILILSPLLRILSKEETVSVIAHELGHKQHHHILKYQLLRGLLAACGLGVFIQYSHDISSLVISAPALCALGLPFLNGFKRHCEFQADRFVVTHSNANSFICALDKLHQQNSSLETSDTIYSAYYHGHPTPQQRKQKILETVNGIAKVHMA